MRKFTATIPLSLYVHLPWCVKKCPYCDFNSHTLRGALPEAEYIQALIEDLQEQLPRIAGREIVSIFFGGGTPSLFSAEGIATILSNIKQQLSFHPAIEITLEANPGTLDESRFTGFRQAGINRLSLGIQSLQNEKLQALGRIHGREQAIRAIEIARKAGFDNLNLDLMHSLPHQSVKDALADLNDALSFEPTHLSWYQLTLEPNTLFHHHPPPLPNEDIQWEILEQGNALLASHNFHQYEISAYSKANYKSVHNRNYWEFGDYLGIGAGAHSKLTDTLQQTISRHWQIKHPRDYQNATQSFVANEKTVNSADSIFEFMLNALRLTEGVPISLFTERTGLAAILLEPMLSKAIDKQLIENNKLLLKTTERGQRFLNDAVGLFIAS